MTLSQPTKSTRDWLRKRDDIVRDIKRSLKGKPKSVRRAAIQRGAMRG